MIEIMLGSGQALRSKALKSIERKYKIDFSQFHYRSFSTNDKDFELDQVKESLVTHSLFDDLNIVFFELHELKKSHQDFILELVEMDHSSFLLILQLNKLPRKNTKFYRRIAKESIHQLEQIEVRDFNHLFNEYIKEHDLVFDSEKVKRSFKEKIDKNPDRLLKEGAKLKVLKRRINEYDLRSLVALDLNESVFDLSNSLLANDALRSLSIYYDLKDKGLRAFDVIGLLAANIRRLYQISLLQDLSFYPDEISSELSISEKQVHFLLRNRIKKSEDLAKVLKELAEIDQKIKLGEWDEFLAFEYWLFKTLSEKKQA